ncbi:amino acid ABC transporter permease [Periweissella fabaria]|uniref:L-cystine transport system permease protein TcyB n=1 Tax=Periweissella fabaria TaxID=546157 RepID=A0ABM8Z7B8_9LACO|nr:amino acid ABC transporter permease [Periweissella fabaria]MCM0596915.1 amino acid ABC transporter permease [Periweissella fabaria]CAH0416653.1 L-cystine transport system permease protein TcyB [Periweissella fabaria]
MLFEIFKDHFFQFLIIGLKTTVPLAIITFILSLIVGTLSAFISLADAKRFTPMWFVQQINRFYIWLFRSTPMLLQLYIIFYGIPKAFPDLSLGVWPAAIIGFTLNTGAYTSETIRGAIGGVPKGQFEAARSLGMSTKTTFLYVVLPQAFRIAVPPLSNTFISLVKDTSLASTISLIEIMQLAQQTAATNFQILDTYIVAAAVYALFSTILSKGQKILEVKFKSYAMAR